MATIRIRARYNETIQNPNINFRKSEILKRAIVVRVYKYIYLYIRV